MSLFLFQSLVLVYVQNICLHYMSPCSTCNITSLDCYGSEQNFHKMTVGHDIASLWGFYFYMKNCWLEAYPGKVICTIQT